MFTQFCKRNFLTLFHFSQCLLSCKQTFCQRSFCSQNHVGVQNSSSKRNIFKLPAIQGVDVNEPQNVIISPIQAPTHNPGESNAFRLPNLHQMNLAIINEIPIGDDPDTVSKRQNNTMRCELRKPRPKPSSLVWIRKRKMKKHQRRKHRKKIRYFLKQTQLLREIKKEKLFRAELLSQIREAEEFDAEAYVKNMLKTIDSVPKPLTPDEIVWKLKELVIKNRSDYSFVLPKPPKDEED